MPVLLAHAIEDSNDIFGISGGIEPPKPPPSVRHCTIPFEESPSSGSHADRRTDIPQLTVAFGKFAKTSKPLLKQYLRNASL